MNKIEFRTALTLAVVYVLRMLGLFMVMPVLAILAIDYPGYSALLVGLAIGGYGLTQALLQIPMGILSDRIGRKPVILIGLAFFALGSLVAGFAENMWWLVAGRLMQGAGAIAGAIMALAADVSREEQRPKVMAIIGISIGFSFYLAVVLGPIFSSHYGLSGLFFITAVLVVVAMLMVQLFVPSAVTAAPQGDTIPVLADIKRLAQQPSLWRLNLSVLVLHLLITLLFTSVPTLISGAGLALEAHWQLYLPVMLMSIVGLLILMKISKSWPSHRPLQLAVGLLILAFVGMFFHHAELVWLVLMLLVFFTGFNYLEANLPALVSAIAPAGKKGSAMGVFASFQFLGAFLGGLLAGELQALALAEYLYLAAAGICILWLFILRNLTGLQRLKRYTLSVDLEKHNPNQLVQELGALPGVTDVTIIIEERAAYLKAEGTKFNLLQARQIAGGNNN